MDKKAALRVKTADGKWVMVPALIAAGGGELTTDETLKMENGVLSVNITDEATEFDPRPITSQGVYGEFAVINALLKTI